MEYAWPGNIRELENAIKHALAMARGTTITTRDLPVQILLNQKPIRHKGSLPPSYSPDRDRLDPAQDQGNAATLSDLSRKFYEAEKASILSALHRHHGNRQRAARELGVSRTTLWRKITMYQLNESAWLP